MREIRVQFRPSPMFDAAAEVVRVLRKNGFDGGIAGVYSRSERQPMKTSGFAPPWTDFAGASRYSGWQFVAEPAFFDSRSSGAQTPVTAPATPGQRTP